MPKSGRPNISTRTRRNPPWLDCTAPPPSSSRPTTVFASRLLFLIRHAVLTLPPSRGPWSACIRVVPSVAFSSTASNVHHARPSCTPTRSRPKLAQRELRHALHAAALHVVALHRSSSFFRCWSRARFGLAVPSLRATLLCRARVAPPARSHLPHPRSCPRHSRTDALFPLCCALALVRPTPASQRRLLA
jgi:hypothetical protein